MDLDEPERFGEVDPDGALGATLGAPARWEAAPGLVGDLRLPPDATAVLVAGMGGSGVAGDVAAAAAVDRLAVPVLTLKDAALPAYVGPTTPLLAVSQSGATEEVLAVAEAAASAGAPLIAVTAGDPLRGLVANRGGHVIVVPAGGQPRHALGSLAGVVCTYLGLGADFPAAVAAQRTVVGALGPHVPTAQNPAKQLGIAAAETGMVHIWSTGRLATAAGVRLAAQLAEHAKLPATAAVLPEVAHNEVVGWHHGAPGEAHRGLVVLRDPVSETAAATVRLTPALELAAAAFAWTTQRAVGSPGDPPLARLAALVLAVDLVSVYAAIVRDVDPTPIAAIDHIKATATAAERP